jgi:hypothetical protein
MLEGDAEIRFHVQPLWNPRCAQEARPPSLDAGAWAGLVVHTDNGEVGARASQSKWDKTRSIVCRTATKELKTFYVLKELGEAPQRNQPKAHGVRQGLLKLCDSNLPSAGSLFEGIHLTVDGWRPDRNDQGWKRRRQEIEVLQKNGVLDEHDHHTSPDNVKPVPRCWGDPQALEKPTEAPVPPKQKIRTKAIIHVERGIWQCERKRL